MGTDTTFVAIARDELYKIPKGSLGPVRALIMETIQNGVAVRLTATLDDRPDAKRFAKPMREDTHLFSMGNEADREEDFPDALVVHWSRIKP